MVRKQSVIMTTNDQEAMRDSLERQVKEYEAAVLHTETALEMKRRILKRLKDELKALDPKLAK